MQTQHILFVEDREGTVKPSLHVVLPPPKVQPPRDVFSEAMLENSSTHQRRSPFDWLVSLGLHIAIVSALLILPLFYTSGLDLQKFNLTFLTAPAMPAAPPPAPPASLAPARTPRSTPVRPYVAGKLTAPVFVPKAVVTTPGETAPPEESLLGVPGGVPGGISGGQLGGVIGGVLGGASKNVQAPAAEGPKTPVRVGGDVRPPRLLYGPAPEYPTLARQSRISGTVIIEAIIDEHGNVTGMRVLSGPALLIPAAMSAVSKRRYEPTVLDGEPMPVDLKVEVNFNFS